MHTIKNPITGANILINGPTYNRLLETKYKAIVQKLARQAVKKQKRPSVYTGLTHKKAKSLKKVTDIKKLPGCSAFGKYTSKDAPFCGPEGGACEKTFPVGTYKRFNAALRYARNAPKPDKIVKCAVRLGLKQNFINKERAEKILEREKEKKKSLNKMKKRSMKKRSMKKRSMKKRTKN
jgi:hypothetical protein